MKTTVRTPKPRNPFVAAVMRRSGGRHAQGLSRQQALQALRRETAQLDFRSRPDT